MTDIVERVARAIRRQKFERTGRLRCLDETSVTPEELGEARAAIAAMRDPTDAMVDAAYAFSSGEGIPETMWTVMIDAALMEQQS
jgi:hypothetical protein